MLPELFIVSGISLDANGGAATAVDGLRVGVERASGEKCGRCWMILEDVGTDEDHPTVCGRCAGVLERTAFAGGAEA